MRAGSRLSLAALFLFGANDALQNAVAEGDTRTISFHHVHTDESITITYKRNGRYDEAALKKLDWFMRDWRRNEAIHMDPHLFDLLWETNREVDGKHPIEVICGYRAPQTNAMLRERTSGVAQFSEHTHGQAIDFFIPGVPLAEIRAIGLRLQRGGVGFYPSSGSPFVHLDTGSVRHWPGITRVDLVKIFPDGRTVHIPTDGHPLAGYRLALADVESHGAVPSQSSLEAARTDGVISAGDVQVAEAAATTPKPRSLLARLFGKSDGDVAPPATRDARKPTVLASLSPARSIAKEAAIPIPAARPQAASAAATAAPRFATASLGGQWAHAAFAAIAGKAAGTRLAFAAETPMPMPAPARVRPMGENVPRLPAEAAVTPSSSDSASMQANTALIGGVGNEDSPWLRAAMLTPSVSHALTVTSGNRFNPQALEPLLQKPSVSLGMTFSPAPQTEMASDHFSGKAVVFLATASFAPQQLSMR